MSRRRGAVVLLVAALALLAPSTSAHENDCDVFLFSGFEEGRKPNLGAVSQCHDDGTVDPDTRWLTPGATHAAVGSLVEGPRDANGQFAPITATVVLDGATTSTHELKWTGSRYESDTFPLDGAETVDVSVVDGKGEAHKNTYVRRL